jgi:hypothetical protein
MANYWLKPGWAYHQYFGAIGGRVDSTSFISLVEGSPNVLKAIGSHIDRLESVVKLFDDLSEYKVSNFAAVSKSFFQRSEAVMDGDFYITVESWPEALCRTLIADLIDWKENSFFR